MTLTTIKNDIQTFGKKKLEYMRNYIAMHKDFQDKVHKQLVGKVYAEQELLKYKEEGESYSQKTSQLLYQQLEDEKGIELAKYKEKEESVTADDAAELTLLSSVKLTVAEMREYLEKYKNKPLAIRVLEDIVKSDPDSTYVEIDMEQFNQGQRLEKLVHFFADKIALFQGSLISEDEVNLVHRGMVIEGSLESLDAELQNYLT